jgi:hypothetical protein
MPPVRPSSAVSIAQIPEYTPLTGSNLQLYRTTQETEVSYHMNTIILPTNNANACLFHMTAQCSSDFNEVLPSNRAITELAVEDMIGHILLEQFESVLVDDVSTSFFNLSGTKHHCVLQIYATCIDTARSSTLYNMEFTEFVLEDRIGCVLMELFGTINIDTIEIRMLN